jgi:hypothetical protein
MTDDTMTDAAADGGEPATVTTSDATKLVASLQHIAGIGNAIDAIALAALDKAAFQDDRAGALLYAITSLAGQVRRIASARLARTDDRPALESMQGELYELANLGRCMDEIAGIVMEGDTDGRSSLMTAVQTQARTISWIADSSLGVVGDADGVRSGNAEAWLFPTIETKTTHTSTHA